MWSAPLSEAKPTGEFCSVAISVSSAGEPLAELLLVVGGAGPGFLLRLAVVVAGQLLDAGGEDRRQHGRIRREKRPQRGFGQRLSHRTQNTPNSFRTSSDRAGDHRPS